MQKIRLQKILAASPRRRARRDLAIMNLLLETGISVSDLVDLNVSDLDLRVARIHIFSSTEDDKWLPLGKALSAIELYLDTGRPELNPKPNEAALFVSQMGERMSRQGIWQILNYWGTKTTPSIKLSPRILRHTAALKMVKAGFPIKEIQILLGHRNPLSTQALLRRLESNIPEKVT